jgi:hypothetical protein
VIAGTSKRGESPLREPAWKRPRKPQAAIARQTQALELLFD